MHIKHTLNGEVHSEISQKKNKLLVAIQLVMEHESIIAVLVRLEFGLELIYQLIQIEWHPTRVMS